MIRVRPKGADRSAPDLPQQPASTASAAALARESSAPEPHPEPLPGPAPVRLRTTEEKRQRSLRAKLVQLAHELQHTAAPPPLTRHEEANALVADLAGHPHAFVIAVAASPMLRGDGGCLLPLEIRARVGHFEMPKLALMTKADWMRVVSEPPICAAAERLAHVVFRTVQHVHRYYDDDAALIWSAKPSSAALVGRFLELGVSPATAVATANTLVRDFAVPVSDRYSIDVTIDGDARRVLSRLGLVEESAPREAFLYKTRELNPSYPGLLDLPLLEVARTVCHGEFPACERCPLVDACQTARERRVRRGMPPLPFEQA